MFFLGNSLECNHTALPCSPVVAGVVLVEAQVVEGVAAVTVAEDVVGIIHISIVFMSSSVTLCEKRKEMYLLELVLFFVNTMNGKCW